MNLILGEELLPYSVLSTTSTICELKYGKQRKIVAHFKDKDPKTGLPTMECTLETASSEQSYLKQISPYVHVKSDREKGSVYKKIELFWPHQLLEVFINDVTVNYSFPEINKIIIKSMSRTGRSKSTMKTVHILFLLHCHHILLYNNRSHNRGRRPQARAISNIGAVLMIWGNFVYF